MKQAVFAFTVLGMCILAGCRSTGGKVEYSEAGGYGYKADITVSPVPATGKYDIKFRIHDRSKDGFFCKGISEYSMRVEVGITANFSVRDENNGCFLTATVREASGKVTMDKVTRIKRNGVVVLSQELSGPLSQ